jgi:diguanylate cyclase (GGDEF)-like protein
MMVFDYDDHTSGSGDNRFVNWITAGNEERCPAVRAQLLHHSLLKSSILVVIALSMSLAACAAIVITGESWAYVWLVAELFIGCAKLSSQLNYASDRNCGRPGDVTGAVVSALVGGVVLGLAGYQCVASGSWLLILLSGICLAAMVSGTAARSAGVPRFAIALMCLMAAPYTLAALVSPIPHLYLIGMQIPLFLSGLILVLFEDHKTLANLYLAQHANRWLADHDTLTGLPNRKMELRCFNSLLDRPDVASDDGRALFTVLCLDLDGFKDVNDRFGHAAGDEVLIAVAGRLYSCIRDVDFLFRVGGDEFVILLPRISPSAVRVIAQQIIARIAEPFVSGQSELHIGVSVGGASALADGVTADELLRSADRAMYEAKRLGKGRFVSSDALDTPRGEEPMSRTVLGAIPI